MIERYDQVAATHYAAYRPPLHQIILRRVLFSEVSFAVGLDVGCGTGYSAIALAEHCVKVCAIDPSPSMLSKAKPHERVIYHGGAAERIPLSDRSVDVVTFAGSLSYVDIGATCQELRRVCQDGAVVIAYDFEVLLGRLLQWFGMGSAADRSDYDHSANLSTAAGFEELEVGSERVSIEVTAPELAHVLLSDSHRSDRFAARYHVSDAFHPLVDDLQSGLEHDTVEADIYFSKYRFVGA